MASGMAPNNDFTLESHGVRVTFKWCGDRYSHHVESRDGSLESCEGSKIETPVFADAHQQGDLLFFSGMSGDRHWSMSVEPTATGLAMDVACRLKSAVGPLGSCYQQTDKITILPEEIDSAPSSEIVLSEANRLEIVPTCVLAEPPVTLRYRYRIAP